MGRAGAALVCAVALSVAAPAAQAASVVDVLEVAYDVTILRPLNFVATVLGAGFFVAAAPLVAPFEGLESAWDTFVLAPYEYTFERELGDF